jgi:hypothetical protein
MAETHRQRLDKIVPGVLAGFGAAAAVMLGVIAIVVMAPRAAPVLWLGVPAGTFAGMWVIHRRLPKESYIIGLVFVPLVALVLAVAAFEIYWNVLGDRL